MFQMPGGHAHVNIKGKNGLYCIYSTWDPKNPLQLYWNEYTKDFLKEYETASIS